MIAKTVLFGGTFDPIHNAHIEAAVAALHRFSAVRLIIIPAANPPHKSEGPHAPFEDRVQMAQLACAGHAGFEVSRIEEGAAKSYSVLTIEKLTEARIGPFAFLIGADAFADIRTWHRWRDVVREVEFIVVDRPGARYAIPEGARVHRLTGIDLAVSSSDIRNRLGQGGDDIPVPAPVLTYIRARGLYRSQIAQISPTSGPLIT